jgi:hypothetical protein
MTSSPVALAAAEAGARMSNRLSIAAALTLALVAGLAWGMWCYRQMQTTSLELSRPGVREAAAETVRDRRL